MNNHKKVRKGFTLIELLTVMAILALLAVTILVSLNSARAKARDAKRKNELHQIQLAMTMWYEMNSNTYPIYAADACSVSGITGCTGAYPSSIGTFLVSMPKDPTNNTTYYYRVKASTGSTFCVIATRLEQESAAFYASPKGTGLTGAGAITCP